MKHRYSPALVVLGVILSFASALANTPPIASFEVIASSDGSQTTLILDASGSYDPDGAIVAYQWLYGDGYSGSGVTKKHTFPAASSYEIMLLVTDDGGAAHSVKQTIDLTQPITPQTPPAEAVAPDGIVPDVVVPYDIPVGNRSGERAPAFALPNQAGEIVELADYLGHLVLLEFWSSSCSSCRASMPHLEALRAEFEDRGLIVITITINRDYQGEWRYLAENGYTQFVSLRESDTATKPTMTDYGTSRIPHALLIDHRGVIRFTGHLSLVQSDMIESYL
ncbi:redoxin domain-containing protein [Candidatus Bipolaricaulota bacterium]